MFNQLLLFLLLFASSLSPHFYLTHNGQQSIHDASIKQVNEPLLIVIDPGHGGKDNGCNVHTYEEKNFTLPFSLKLGDKIQYHSEKKVKVMYTRSHDISISLDKRSQIANAANADLFISVHANSIHDPSVHGFESYVYGTSEGTTSIEAKNLEEDVSDFIMTNLLKSNHIKESILLAQTINNKVKQTDKLKNRGVKQAEFRVLKDANMPSVLLEMGYLTNPKDARLLLSKKGQDILADKIAKAILEYLKV